MSDMDALVAWLTATVDEIEQAAQATIVADLYDSGQWRIENQGVFDTASGLGVCEAQGGPNAAHIALHDPRAVLARVEAERVILAQHVAEDRYLNGVQVCRCCAEWDISDDGESRETFSVIWPCPTIRVLAYGHRYDASGFRDEWKLGS